MEKLFLILGIIFICYFIGIIIYAGPGSPFAFFWFISGAVCIASGFFSRYVRIHERKLPLPEAVKAVFFLFCVIGIVIFLFVEGCIISGMQKKGDAGLDYIIVLGAQVKGTKPSKALRKRLDKAVEYLTDNAETAALVSGGQGSDEETSEAEAMKNYLVEQGIESTRIVEENKSRNTKENMEFSFDIIQNADAEVGVITNNFHVFRAEKLGRKTGFKNIQGIAAKSDWFMQPNYMIRECLAVIKDFLFGNF